MEERMKKYRQVSPDRAIVWTEKSPKYHYNHNYNQPQQQKQPNSKVPVVYYLCRNQQLEHPHFMEVPLSSSDGLYLRDVIERLNVLRGRGMALMYSWSCKRSYKNGYVWHDLSDDDLIHPAHGNEYVLKGSELFEESNSGRFSPAGTYMLQNQKALPEPPSARSQEESSSSSSLNGRTPKSSHDDEISPPVQHSCSSAVSPESSNGKNSWNGSLSLAECNIYKSNGLADASTQTEEKGSKGVESQDICVKGVSTDDGSLEPDSNGTNQNQISQVKKTPENCGGVVSPPPCTSSASSSSGGTDTLENLIRADVKKLNSFRILEEEGVQMSSNMKLKASNMIMQLLSCGSISVKDHSFGIIPTYKPSFPHSKFPSLFSTSLMLGSEVDCLREKSHLTGMRLEDKEYFSGSIAETSKPKESATVLKRSSSYSSDRSTHEQLDSIQDNEEGSSTSLKCIPRSIRASISKQPKCESMRSPISEGPRISSERVESSRTIKSSTSNGGSKRMTEPDSDFSMNDKENVIKIEERLASGARVIIQSKVYSDSSEV